MRSVGIIDYRCGNLFNLAKALKYVGAVGCEIITDASAVERFDKLLLPGVGSFRKGMQMIQDSGFSTAIRKHISIGKPMLGICAGMQLMTQSSEEFGKTEGLGLVEGEIISLRRLDPAPGILVPNIGWHAVSLKETKGEESSSGRFFSKLFDGVDPDALCYFAHSYALESLPADMLFWTTSFGTGRFISAFEKDNLFAVQFHPELSGSTGLTLLKNFISV